MKIFRFILVFSLLFPFLSVKSQNSEQYISNVVNEINYKVEEVHQLADQKKMYECIDKLDEVYFKISSERKKGTFDEEYKKAKRNNPNFTYKIRNDLPQQLESYYWKSKLAQCEQILANQDVVIKGMIAAKKLNNDDKFLALLKQLKTSYDAISGIIENTATFNPLKLGYDLHGNFNDAIDNYKDYENADLANLEIDAKMAKFNLTISKAEKNKTNFHYFKKYLKDNYDAVTSFKANVDYLNKIKNSIDSGPIDKLDFVSHKYNWNYGPFQEEVEELCKYFNADEDYCSDFELKYDKINRNAERSLSTVLENIKASDDQANKQEFLNENNARWTEYKGIVDPIFQKVYKTQCEKPITQETLEEDASNNAQNNEVNENTQITANDRVLNLKILSFESQGERYTNQYRAGQQAKVYFTAKWDGQWLERTQLKILIDDEIVLDEILEFRNNMGDFLSEFYKTILIPKHIKKGSHTLSIKMSTDPKIFNKSIQLRCRPQTLQFSIGETQTQAQALNEKNDKEVSDSNNLFEGSSVKSNSITQESNSVSTPPGKRIPNKLYHGWWSWDMGNRKILLKQNGYSVKIGTSGVGTIRGGSMVYNFADEDGITGTDTYTLIEDGYEMEVQKEWTIGRIKDKIRFSMSAPTPEKIQEFKNKNGRFENYTMSYYPNIMTQFNDSDNDQVHDDYDNCPNTPAGFTVDNGGVDIAGCPTEQGKAVASVSNVSQPTQNTTSSAANTFDGAGETTQNKNSGVNPFDGATSGGTTSSTSKSLAQSKPNSQPKTNTANNVVKTPPPRGFIGTISNTGNGKGSYCSFEVSNFKQTDRIIFHVLSGDLKKTEIIWRTESGSWQTKYEGPQTTFNASDYLTNLPKNITHLIFTVNARHNRNYLPNACEVEVWHLPLGAKVPSNWKNTNNLGVDQVSDDFNKLLQKADDAFNKKYWQENPSLQSTSNREQASFDLLRRAEQLIAQQKNVENQYSMVLRLTEKYSEYAKRVYANSAKVQFIEVSGRMLAQYGGKANSLSSAKANAYTNMAKGWRVLAKAAMWGNQQYNKMYCDTESKKYYDLALNEDRNNVQLQKTVEKINAPKKAVPAAASELDKIRVEAWNEAEMIRHKLETYIPINLENELNKKVEINAMELANLTLEHSSGTVYIKRSGAKDWEKIEGNLATIFNGDAIKTSDDAKGVSVTFQVDHTFFAIKNNAEVLFIDDHKFVIKRGGARVEVTKKGKEFLVISPFHTVGVRGTEFEVNVKADQTTETYVYEGVVETRNGTDIAYLEVGDKVIVKKGDDNISESTFNVTQRNQSEWSGIEQQKINHQRSVESTNINVEPTRTDKLTDATRTNDRKIQNVTISASPDKKYHEVLVSNSLDYQHIAIVARCPVNVSKKTALTVNWYFNNLLQPISVGNYEVLPEASQYDATIFSYDRPLNPGIYKVEFIMNSNVIGRSEVIIKPQESYDEQEAKKYYVEAVKGMDMALQFLNGGDYKNAGEMARSSLPVLQSVLYNAPDLPDVLAVLQAAQTVNDLDKVNNLLQQNNSSEALKWAKVCLATVSNAHLNCKDYQFKQTLKNLKLVVEEIVFELNQL